MLVTWILIAFAIASAAWAGFWIGMFTERERHTAKTVNPHNPRQP